MKDLKASTIAVIGLGYVGLPLAVEFAKHFTVIGYDLNTRRVRELTDGHDRTLEVDQRELSNASSLTFTNDPELLRQPNVYIVTVPTPVDAYRRPDLGPVRSATAAVAKYLNKGDIVIYESTVYPGATEEECVPILERTSGLALNTDFYVGYSPERINPGDKTHTLTTIVKITSGSCPEAASFVDLLYSTIIQAGTFKAPSIRVAEAAKVIENTQRDVNIALVNELAILFDQLNIDTADVLEAARTKWNFLDFRPGLVGGHCIGVDPYYLTHKAAQIGYHPEIILAGRRINDSMAPYVARRLVKAMAGRGIPIAGGRVLILGLTFKENTPDLRNTKVVDIVSELRAYQLEVDVCDPWADPSEALAQHGIRLVREPEPATYSGIVLAVAHRQFVADGDEGLLRYLAPGGVFFDLKNAISDRSGLRL